VGRRATVTVTVVALASLAMGSWLVASAAGDTGASRPAAAARPTTGVALMPTSTSASGSGASTVAPTAGEPEPSLPGAAGGAPGSRSATTAAAPTSITPSTTPPSATPPSATPPLSTPPLSTPSSPPSSSNQSRPVPSSPTTSVVLAATPAGAGKPVIAAARAATPHLSPAPVAPVPAATGSTTVAAALIAAVDRQSGRRIPATADNISLLQRWIANEGGMWADNPLNTSLHASAYPHQFTSSGQDSGIPIFPSMGVGVTATATTLVSNPSYARILGTLGSGTASCLAFARAVIRSPWASSHYGRDPSGFCSGHIAPARRGRAPHPRRR